MLLGSGAFAPADAGLRFGGGINYMRTLGSIKDNPEWDENAVQFVGALQYGIPMFKFEGDVGYTPDYGGTGNGFWQPQAWAMIGGFIYGGLGIGVGYFDGNWADDPFYNLRVGVDLGLGGLAVDVYATYRFFDTEVIEGLGTQDLDSITFGAILWFGG